MMVCVYLKHLLFTSSTHLRHTEERSLSEIASQFRALMSEDMSYYQHGQYRKRFYDDVLARAKVFYSFYGNLYDT